MTKAKRGRKKGNGKRKGRTAPGRLTPTGGNHREATETARREHRQYRALQLYCDHRLSMRQVAEVLVSEGYPCTAKTIAEDIYAELDREARERKRMAVHRLDLEDRKLGQIERALLPLAMGEMPVDYAVKVTGRGRNKKTVKVPMPLKAEARTRLQIDALGSLRRNSESRRRLHGIDQQPDAGYVPTSQVASIVGLLVGDILAITTAAPELRSALAAAMKRRFGVIDVTPERETGT